MMRQILRISFVVGAIGIAYPALGQHNLVCLGTDRVLIGSSSVFQMKDCRAYQITGISVNGNLMFATPFGGADYLGHRFEVVETGQYANGQYGNADVTLQKIISNVSGGMVNWSGVLTLTGVQPIGQCYAALQWFYEGYEGCRFSTAVVILGTLNPGVPVSVALSTGIDQRPAENGGTYSFHLWSGEHEIKLRKIEGPES